MDKQSKEDQERRRGTSLSSVKGRYKKNAAAEEELQGNECDRVRETAKDRAYISTVISRILYELHQPMLQDLLCESVSLSILNIQKE